MKSLGADLVIDYTKENFIDTGKKYDIIFDAVGKKKSSHIQFQKALTNNGKFISVDDGNPGRNAICKNNLNKLKELVETGKLLPVIDKIYKFEQIVEAHRYVDQGHKKGNVIVTITTDLK